METRPAIDFLRMGEIADEHLRGLGIENFSLGFVELISGYWVTIGKVPDKDYSYVGLKIDATNGQVIAFLKL